MNKTKEIICQNSPPSPVTVLHDEEVDIVNTFNTRTPSSTGDFVGLPTPRGLNGSPSFSGSRSLSLSPRGFFRYLQIPPSECAVLVHLLFHQLTNEEQKQIESCWYAPAPKLLGQSTVIFRLSFTGRFSENVRNSTR